MHSKPLANCHVHIAGMGRVGTAVAMALHSSGVGTISCNDPQLFEVEQLEVCAFGHPSDLGRPKVFVLERFLHGRQGLTFLPLHAPNQSRKLRAHISVADLIVSSANNLGARLFVEREAIRLGKPIVQACVQDARKAIGGTVHVWRPREKNACFGCLFPTLLSSKRGEDLPLPVCTMIGSLAAQIALNILRSDTTMEGNLVTLDAGEMAIQQFSIGRRENCRICRPR